MMTSGYQLATIEPPDVFPIDLDNAKLHCRVDPDITIEDELIQNYIETATELAEDYTKRSFCERVLEATFRSWWHELDNLWGEDCRLALPFGPVIEVISITYLDQDGNEQSMASDTFRSSAAADYWYVHPVGAEWPAAKLGTIRIRYRAGYESKGSPAGADQVPSKAKQAIRMAVAHFYANRESVTAEGRQAIEIPMGFERLLDPLKVYP